MNCGRPTDKGPVESLDATLVTVHDPEEWPKFKKAPEYYT